MKGEPHTPRSVLVTGGAGFIGANFVEYLLQSDSSVRVTTLDSLTYAGSLDNLAAVIGDARHDFVRGDITDGPLVTSLLNDRSIDTIVHFAAESHVDRSITGPAAFITTNVVGTFTLLEAARAVWLGSRKRSDVRFHHVSTDEVFGDLPTGKVFAVTGAPGTPGGDARLGRPAPRRRFLRSTNTRRSSTCCSR